VSYAAEGLDNAFGRFLASKPLVYLGTISYGLYVYHVPIYQIVHRQAILATLLTIVVASLSWYFYEKPVNSLKRHFDYPRHSKVEVASLKPRRKVGNTIVPIGDLS